MPSAPSPGPLIRPEDLAFLEPIARLHTVCPFDPLWDDLVDAALRLRPARRDVPVATRDGALSDDLARLSAPLATLITTIAADLAHGKEGTPRELAFYQGAALYVLWEQYGRELQVLIDQDEVGAPFYRAFEESHRFLFAAAQLPVPEPAHLLALYYQARRTWHFAATRILGRSRSAAAARVGLWRANMGRDVCAYADGLYHRMDETPVLITGETGTGKDLAAQCVGWSRYIPFDPVARRFARRATEDFHARNLCEVPGELLASALFGHRRGSFTGATTDATGYLALAAEYGTLFLDEVGEIPEHVQAQLLRPFQNREYVPVGETRPRRMLGRLVFATHRDLKERCGEGKFRPDLYQRIKGLPIHMPPLREMLAEAPGEMEHYVRAFVAEKIDSPARVDDWTERVVRAVQATQGEYAWPGNLRELRSWTERQLLTGGPPSGREGGVPVPMSPLPEGTGAAPASTCVPSSGILGRRAKAGEVTLEEVNRAFVTRVYVATNLNKAETARRLGLDTRTVQRLLDPGLLARLLGERKK